MTCFFSSYCSVLANTVMHKKWPRSIRHSSCNRSETPMLVAMTCLYKVFNMKAAIFICFDFNNQKHHSPYESVFKYRVSVPIMYNFQFLKGAQNGRNNLVFVEITV